jgi:geranylgeranyl diphosphate synthase type I
VTSIIAKVNNFLRKLCEERGEPAGLYRMMGYHLGWLDESGAHLPDPLPARYGGKKLRAALCMYACEAAGGSRESALPAAAAIELIQNFSLIHDDIEDGDRERRHRPTVWVLWGVSQAINTGSSMQALVNTALLRTQAPPETVLDLASALTEAMMQMTEGQHLDISFETRNDVTPEQYRAMASLKTGALMEAAAYAGARIATSDASALLAWRRFGRCFGEAFQARDDLLGVIGEPAQTGKPVGNDIRARKKALPLVCARRNAGPDDQAILDAALAEDPVSDDAVRRVTEVMRRSGALDDTRRVVEEATDQALAALNETGASGAALHSLQTIVRQSVGRRR